MSYYSNNFYPNYSNYNNPYQNQAPAQQAMGLQGKIVDSAEMVKVTEVPFGGFAVFPKGDMSEIYVKSWNSNGTTQIHTYRPVPIEETPEAKQADTNALILQQIANLDSKLDAFINGKVNNAVAAKENINEQKGVSANAY